MVMLSPLGTSGTYFDTGSSSRSLPSWASCRITADVIVLVTEAIRKWVSAVGRLLLAQLRRAGGGRELALRRAQQHHGSPGTSSSVAVSSTRACRAAGSIVFKPRAPPRSLPTVWWPGGRGRAARRGEEDESGGHGSDRRAPTGCATQARSGHRGAAVELCSMAGRIFGPPGSGGVGSACSADAIRANHNGLITSSSSRSIEGS